MRRVTFFTYLVGWDDARIIKAGITTHHRRWRSFCTRGATLHMLHLAGAETSSGWVYLEGDLERYLSQSLTRAFPVKADAAPYLGPSCGGYSECYVADDSMRYADALASCIRIMQEHPTGQCGTDMHALMHGRTDVRTYEDPWLRESTSGGMQRARV